ncbi:hypothetical protein EVA_04503, partial [gut metagenome]
LTGEQTSVTPEEMIQICLA